MGKNLLTNYLEKCQIIEIHLLDQQQVNHQGQMELQKGTMQNQET